LIPSTHPGSCLTIKVLVSLIELHSNSYLGQVFLMSLPYQPLPAGRHFRLLELQGGSNEDPIACRLRVDGIPDESTPSTGPGYEALSYAWGPPNPTHQIIINGWPYTIRQNLWSFLKHRRNPTTHSTLWIDALCINQKDVVERGAQVQLMGSIYRSADRVIVWLGDDCNNSSLVMNWMGAEGPSRFIDDEHRFLNALEGWVSRNYWSRTWVVQEFLLARDIILVCGRKHVSWRCIERFCQEGPSPERAWNLFKHSQPYGLFKQRMNRHVSGMNLLSLLLNNRATVCMDFRDKVYSMLGLAVDYAAGRTLDVDYQKPPQALFCDVLHFIAPAPANIFRFGAFLKGLLQVNDPLMEHCCSSRSASAHSRLPLLRPLPNSTESWFQAFGFKTGKVVCNDVLTGSALTKWTAAPTSSCSLESYRSSKLPWPSRAVESLSRDKVQESLVSLEALDLQRLCINPTLLTSVSHRSFSGSRKEHQLLNGESLSLTLVVVYFFGQRAKNFMIGLAFGNVSKEDAVIQFPGYDAAFTMSAATTTSGDSFWLTGKVICVDPEGPWTDCRTSELYSFAGIQSERCLSDPKSVISVLVTSEELLALLQ
jgi:hypothetical protein